jgi:hypothetical protein
MFIAVSSAMMAILMTETAAVRVVRFNIILNVILTAIIHQFVLCSASSLQPNP